MSGPAAQAVVDAVAATATGRATPPREELLARVAEALAEIGRRAPGSVAVVSVPAAVAEPWRLTDADLVWAPPDGGAIAGRGAAIELVATGAGRFAAIRRLGEAALARVSERRHGDSAAPPPRLFGGFAFAAAAGDGGAPRASGGLGDARFVLPRLLCGRDRDGDGYVQVACATPGESAARATAVAELGEAMAELAAPPTGPRAAPAGGGVVADDPSGFLARVEAIRGALARGEAQKIVCARSIEVELVAELALGAVHDALAARFADCYRFAFAVPDGGARFVGASPELLIRRRGDAIESESLAGTAPRGEGGRALLASAKDRGEQAVVTDAIAGALAPLCSALELPGAPEVRALGDVRHLRTPIRGRLRAPRHVLELAELLHPTPAVGGLPRAAALAFIARHEAWRGWYAGCVGWFDGEGDGELAVAIRSALVRGRRAELFAGAGIVAGSDPVAELDETAMKLEAMLGALGVRP